MIVRFPGQPRDRDPGWQAEQELQADPLLKLTEHRRASPATIALAGLFGLAVVTMVFYGLNREPSPASTSVASRSDAPVAPTTSGSAPPATDANAPSPADKANTAAHGTSSGQSSAQPQPTNQGQADRPGRSGESR